MKPVAMFLAVTLAVRRQFVRNKRRHVDTPKRFVSNPSIPSQESKQETGEVFKEDDEDGCA